MSVNRYLDEILADEGLSRHRLDVPCERDHLLEMARQLARWQSVAPYLGLDDVDEEAILENRGVEVQRVKMLDRWKRKQGGKATYLALATALASVQRRDLVEKLCGLVRSVSEEVAAPVPEPSRPARPAIPRLIDPPTLSQLQKLTGHNGKTIRILDIIQTRWESVAMALELDFHEVETIKRNERRVEESCTTVMRSWLRGGCRVPVTWETLVSALDDATFYNLAKDIKEALKSPAP